MFSQGLRAWSKVAAGFILPGSLMRSVDTLSSSRHYCSSWGNGSQSATLLSKFAVLQLRTALWPASLGPVICGRYGKVQARAPLSVLPPIFIASLAISGYRQSIPLADGLLSLSTQHYCSVQWLLLHQAFRWLGLIWTMGIGWECAGSANMRRLVPCSKIPPNEHPRLPLVPGMSWGFVWVKVLPLFHYGCQTQLVCFGDTLWVTYVQECLSVL